jgi:2',3'-cyclic-nucleotide 2'-phosphodiesterase (5'-nucleotidase family)
MFLEEIILFHTNDLHSHLENWLKIRRYISQKRKQYRQAGKSVITLDLGDFIDRWHPLTEATNGQANIELMNALGYDAVTIGNNEGVGNSKKQLEHLYDQAEFAVILDNLEDPQTQQAPAFSQPYKIIETQEGTKIGLIAFTAPFPLTYNPNGWNIYSVDELMPSLLNEVRPLCDILVLMSHLGIDTDLKIAHDYPEIDVLLGSHTHHLFPKGEKINQVQLAAAGKFGQYIGEVQLVFDRQTRQLSSKATVIATADLPRESEDQAEIAGYLTTGHQLLQAQTIAQLSHDLTCDLRQSYPLMEVALAALKERGQTAAAILNNGLFLKDLPAGVVNEDQLHESLPHPMHLITVTLTGADLIRLIGEMEKNRHFLRKFPITGMGFRGKIFGELRYSGIRYEKATKAVYWLEEPVDKEKLYTFTTVDHFQFIPFFPTIELAGEVTFLFPEFLRNAVGSYLKAHYPIP